MEYLAGLVFLFLTLLWVILPYVLIKRARKHISDSDEIRE